MGSAPLLGAMLTISRLMRHEVASVSPDAPVRRVVEVMVDTGVEEVLVVDGRGRVVGSVGDDQLVAGLHASRSRSWWGRLGAEDGGAGPEQRLSSLAAADVMLRRVFPVDPATSATSAVRLFDEYGVNVMPVVDHGVLVGVVFRGDLIRRLLLPDAFGRPART
jgi:predicted transcriptional regulator